MDTLNGLTIFIIFAICTALGSPVTPHTQSLTDLFPTLWNTGFSTVSFFCLLLLVSTILLLDRCRRLKHKINVQKKAHDELTITNNQYSTLEDAIPISIFWKNTSLVYISANRVFAQQVQKPVSTIPGLTDNDLFNEETAKIFEDDDRQVLTSGKTLTRIHTLNIEEKKRWFNIKRQPFFDKQDNTIGILGMFNDVTEQQQSEYRFLESQHFNESVLRSTLNLIYIYDLKDDTVVYTNPHFRELLGYSAEEIESMHSAFHYRLIHQNDIYRVNDMIARWTDIDSNSIEAIEFRMHDATGSWYWFQGRYTAFKSSTEEGTSRIIGTLHDITERIATEKKLKEAFDRAQRYLNIVETIIIVLDQNGCITLVNRKGIQLLGYSEPELIGKNWFDNFIDSSNFDETNRFSTVITSKDIRPIERYENTIITASGQRRIIAWHNSLLTESDGNIVGLLCAGEDITIRKDADELLKTDKLRQNMLLTLNQLSNITVERIMDYALDSALILTKSKIGYLYFYNESTRIFNLYSWSKTVMKECTVLEKQTTYELDKTGLWGEAVRQRRPIITNNYHADNIYKRGIPEGHVLLERHLNLPVFDNGAIVAVIGVANKPSLYTENDVRHLQLFMDGIWKIKKRIDTEEELENKVAIRTIELRKAHDELERFFTLSPDLLCIADMKGRLIRCNKAWEQTLGYTIHELIDREYITLVHPDDTDATIKQMEHLASGKEVVDFSNRFRCKDGSYRWIEWHSNSIDNLAYAAARDITEKKKSHESLLRTKNEAERANHAKSFFLANMSHEIRTPLNAVIGYSELLSTLATDEKQQQYIESIMTAGRNLLRLINDILDLSKIEANMMSINLGVVNLKSLLNEIEQIFSFTIREKQLDFSIEIDQNLPQYLLLDEVRLRQVLLNIVGNAVKFTDSGFIILSVTKQTNPEQSDTITLCIDIKDSGMGIHPDEHSSIFEAFHQQNKQSAKYGGTGLGLTISKKLIEIMNGTISIESILNEGSTFTIRLNNVAVASLVPGDSKKPSLTGIKKIFTANTVLIADSIFSDRDIFSTFLTEAGLTIITAENGFVAIDIAQKKRPTCIIMNLMMSDVDGITAATMLKSNIDTASIPIIALTSLPSDSKSNIDSHLFSSQLSKPVTFDQLITELKKYLPYNEDADESQLHHSVHHQLSLPQDLIEKASVLLGPFKNDDVRAFANQLTDFGEQHAVPEACEIGAKLLSYTEHFNIEAVRTLLKELMN